MNIKKLIKLGMLILLINIIICFIIGITQKYVLKEMKIIILVLLVAEIVFFYSYKTLNIKISETGIKLPLHIKYTSWDKIKKIEKRYNGIYVKSTLTNTSLIYYNLLEEENITYDKIMKYYRKGSI